MRRMFNNILFLMFFILLTMFLSIVAYALEPYTLLKVEDISRYMNPDSTDWKRIPTGIHFVGAKSKWKNLTKRQTVFKGVYDTYGIVFLIICEHPADEAMFYRKGLSRDGKDFFSGEDVEIFLNIKGDNGGLYQFAILPDGALFDSRNGDKTWNGSGIKVIPTTGPDLWGFVLFIPFGDLKSADPVDKSKWTFNICRSWPNIRKQFHPSSWVKLKNNGYHSPECFAPLIFGKARSVDKTEYVSQHPEFWINNSSLDQDTDKNRVPDGWEIPDKTITEYNEKAKYDPDHYIAGKKKGIILRKPLNISVVSQKNFVIGYTVSGSSSTYSIDAVFKYPDQREAVVHVVRDKNAPNHWEKIDVSVNVPSGARVLKALEFIQSADSGRTRFDNIKIVPDQSKQELTLGQLPSLPEMVGEPLDIPSGFNWGIPSAKKRKILFWVRGNNYIIEKIVKTFCAQFGFEYDIIEGGAAANPEEIVSNVKQKKYDAVFYTGRFPGKAHPALKRLIKEGTGLVALSSFGGRKRKTEKIYLRNRQIPLKPPVDFVPLYRMSPDKAELKRFGIEEIRKGTFGKGRFIEIVCADRQFYRHGIYPAIDEIWLAENGIDIEEILGFDWWNYYHLLYGKCLKWVADGTGSHIVKVVNGKREYKPGEKITFQINDSSLPIEATLFRNEEAVINFPAKEPTATGEQSEVDFKVPPDAVAGNYFLNFKLKNPKGGVIDWGSFSFCVTPPGNIGLKEISVASRRFDIGKGVPFTVKIRGHLKTGYSLRSELSDAYGRIVWREVTDLNGQLPDAGLAITASPFPHSILTSYAKITVSLCSDNKEVDRKSKDIYFALDREKIFKEYIFSAYAWIPLYCRPAVFRLFREIGINTVNCWPNGSFRAAKSGFLWTNNWGGLIRHKDKLTLALQERRSKIVRPEDKHLRDGCLSDPEWQDLLQDSVKTYCHAVKRNPPLGSFLCDEMTLAAPWHGEPMSEPSRDPVTINAYREYLKDKYKNIGALNNQWDTDYKDFGEIIPPLTIESRKKENFSSWVEFRLFMDRVMMSAGKSFAENINKHDPLIRCGQPNFCYEGPFTGIDPYLLATSRTGALSYGMNEFNQSFKKPDTTVWNWSFYRYPEMEQIRGNLWRRLFHGSTGASIFGIWFQSSGKTCGFLHPHIGLTKRALDIKKAVEEIVNGAGRLIINTPRVKPQFVFHFSQPSMHMSWLESNDPVSFAWSIRKSKEVDSYMNFFRSRKGFEKLIQDVQWQFDYRVDEQITRGALEGYKVLVLPMSIGIDKKARDTSLQWQQKGGIIVADLRAGARDSLGKPGDLKWIEHVFGIRKRLSMPSYKISKLVLNKNISVDVAKGAEVEVLEDTQVLGRFPDGTPACIIHRNGKGVGIYLNFVAVYTPEIRNLLRDILLKYGVDRDYRITDNEDHDAYGYELVRFSKGKDSNSYIGILKDPDSKITGDAYLHIPQTKTVYDIITSRCFAKTKVIPLQVAPGDARLLTLSPGLVKGIDIKGDISVSKGSCLHVIASLKTDFEPGYRVFNFNMTDPDGQKLWQLRKNVDSSGKDGTWEGHIPLALNDKTGTYKLELQDVASGRKSSFEFDVK